VNDVFQPDAALLPLIEKPDHQRFTVSATAYMRNQDRAALNGRWIAVHYQDPPRATETGRSISMRFPTLIVADYVDDPAALAEKVAAILNKYWDDEVSDGQ
jgi:hypothetical protein